MLLTLTQAADLLGIDSMTLRRRAGMQTWAEVPSDGVVLQVRRGRPIRVSAESLAHFLDLLVLEGDHLRSPELRALAARWRAAQGPICPRGGQRIRKLLFAPYTRS
jgi:hypothetical protein